nr:DUF6427 family protein [uncultured Allomuricauda sp.]
MISSFFGKTKPINYIVLSVFLFLFYSVFIFFEANQEINVDTIPLDVLTVGTLLLSIYIISRIVRVEKVTDFSSYAIFFFVLLFVAFSKVLGDKNAIFCNFFLLLAVWRLLAVKSIKNVKHKIFDASLLICIASLFYDWAVVFFLLVFFVINVYDRKTFKNWLVPIVGILTFFMLAFTFLKVNGELSFFADHYRFSIDFLKTDFFTEPAIIKLLIYVFLLIVVMSLVFLKVRKKGGGKLVPLRIVFLTFIFGAFINLFKSIDASPVLITFFPAAVFLTNYIETIKKAKLKEVVVVICVALSFVLFLVELNL